MKAPTWSGTRALNLHFHVQYSVMQWIGLLIVSSLTSGAEFGVLESPGSPNRKRQGGSAMRGKSSMISA